VLLVVSECIGMSSALHRSSVCVIWIAAGFLFVFVCSWSSANLSFITTKLYLLDYYCSLENYCTSSFLVKRCYRLSFSIRKAAWIVIPNHCLEALLYSQTAWIDVGSLGNPTLSGICNNNISARLWFSMRVMTCLRLLQLLRLLAARTVCILIVRLVALPQSI